VTNDTAGAEVVTKQALEVTIPGAGRPTGVAPNSTGGFNGDAFLFASLDGLISGWRSALGTTAEIVATRSSAIYTGLTLTTNSSGPLLLAANFAEGTLDAYNTSGALVQQFADASAPAGYAPFNVQAVKGTIFVMFAKRDEATHEDVPGDGNGLIDTFDPQTGTFQRFAAGSDAGGNLHQLNSPWGVALAPHTFGVHGGELLVGNLGSGTILAFGLDGEFRGFLKGIHDGPIVIEGLWGLTFGNGGRAGSPDVLFFGAGPVDETHGLFGSLTPAAEVDLHP
jgi:uncharacterized protein (TIGR03118 family)